MCHKFDVSMYKKITPHWRVQLIRVYYELGALKSETPIGLFRGQIIIGVKKFTNNIYIHIGFPERYNESLGL